MLWTEKKKTDLSAGRMKSAGSRRYRYGVPINANFIATATSEGGDKTPALENFLGIPRFGYDAISSLARPRSVCWLKRARSASRVEMVGSGRVRTSANTPAAIAPPISGATMNSHS